MKWRLGLSPWIIQDGNYPDFGVGQRVEVAVECGFSEPVTPATGELHATHTGESDDFEATYAVCAEVIHRPSSAGVRGVHSPLWWQWRKITQEIVLDCGPFRALAEGYAASMVPEGVTHFAAQRATLSVDSFTYFERLARVPGFPALIYTWTVDAILLANPEATGRTFTNVRGTDAWNHSDGGQYILECTLLDVPPKWDSATAVGF